MVKRAGFLRRACMSHRREIVSETTARVHASYDLVAMEATSDDLTREVIRTGRQSHHFV